MKQIIGKIVPWHLVFLFITFVILFGLAVRIPNPIQTLVWGPVMGSDPDIMWISEDERVFFYEYSESHKCAYGEICSETERIPFHVFIGNGQMRTLYADQYPHIDGVYARDEFVFACDYRINFGYDTLKMAATFLEGENRDIRVTKTIIFHKKLLNEPYEQPRN